MAKLASYKTASGNQAFNQDGYNHSRCAIRKVTKPQAVIWPLTLGLKIKAGENTAESNKTASGNQAYNFGIRK